MSRAPDVITRLADLLYGPGLVTHDTKLAVQYPHGLSPYERATKLLDPAVAVAQYSVEKAKKFCECLQECGISVPGKIVEGNIAVRFLKFYITQTIFRIIK